MVVVSFEGAILPLTLLVHLYVESFRVFEALVSNHVVGIILDTNLPTADN